MSDDIARIDGYAAAVLDIARAEGDSDGVTGELAQIARAFETSDDLLDTLRDPRLSLDRKKGVIDDIIGGYEELPDSLKKKTWIELRLEEAKDKLANFIALNPEEVIMPVEAERLRKEVEALRPRIKVHAFPYYDVGKIGGSLRCNTCPLVRL